VAKYKVELIKQGGRFIDPTNVGSSIQWRATLSARPPDPSAEHEWEQSAATTTDCELVLSDCSRLINWEIAPNTNTLDKLDNAIEELKACRRAVAEVMRRRAKIRKAYGLPSAED